jgi:Toxin SymE, type I toxin-antitoxin system
MIRGKFAGTHPAAAVTLLKAGILPPNKELFDASMCPLPGDKALFSHGHLKTCKESSIEPPPPVKPQPRRRRRQPSFKPRQLKVSYHYTESSDEPVPFLRMSGWWLADAGFEAGTNIRVTVEPGRLVIEAAPPEFISRPVVLQTRRRFMEASSAPTTIHDET